MAFRWVTRDDGCSMVEIWPQGCPKPRKIGGQYCVAPGEVPIGARSVVIQENAFEAIFGFLPRRRRPILMEFMAKTGIKKK